MQSSVVSAGMSLRRLVLLPAVKRVKLHKTVVAVVICLQNVARSTGRQRYMLPSKLKRSPRSNKRKL